MNQKLLADIAHFAPTAGSMFCTQLHTATAQHAHTRSMCLALPQRLNIGKFKQAIELALHQENLSVSHESAQPSDVRLRQNNITVEVFDFCHLNPNHALERVKNWMEADLEMAVSLQPHRCLYRQVLFVCHHQIFWYQRYHHVSVNQDHFFGLTQTILNLYQQFKHPVPLPHYSLIVLSECPAKLTPPISSPMTDRLTLKPVLVDILPPLSRCSSADSKSKCS